MSEMRLFNADGNRLYLTQSERLAFLEFSRLQRPEVRTFAETLAYTGCRKSEALELVPKRIELDECRIYYAPLKNAARMFIEPFQFRRSISYSQYRSPYQSSPEDEKNGQ